MLVSLSSRSGNSFFSQMSLSVAMANMFAMLITTVTTQMVLIFVPAKKDTLEMDSHVKVNKSSLHYLKQAAMEIGPHFRDLFSRTTIVFLLNYLLYITYVSRCR